MRNRRYVGRKGPLVVFGDEFEIAKAFRNLPGVETASVNSLNLLQVILQPFRCRRSNAGALVWSAQRLR